MLAARRRIIDQPMVPSVMEPGKLVPDMLVPRSPDNAALIDAYNLPFVSASNEAAIASLKRRAELDIIAERGADGVKSGDWSGSFVNAPPEEAGYLGVLTYPLGAQDARSVRRHELMHGYTAAARRGYDGLPAWPQAVGSMPRWLSRPLDELGAQRVGGTPFMEIPWDFYASHYAQQGDQGAARVARALEAAQRARRMGGRAAEFAADHPVLLGAGVGTAYLLNQALAEEESE